MKPMLAATIKTLEDIRFPVVASPKFDGIRALVIDGVVMSRNLKPIPNRHVQELFGKKEYNGFDGELIVGYPWAVDCFNVTSSAVMSRDGEPKVTFIVFDNYLLGDRPYKERWQSIPMMIMLGGGRVERIAYEEMAQLSKLRRYETKYLKAGYEGVMLRDPNGFYKHGRATVRGQELMKLKRFEDAEAVIEGFIPWQHNTNEQEIDNLGAAKRSKKKAGMVELPMVGALKVRDLKTGVQFEIGTGFSKAQREEYWQRQEELLDRIVKYKHQPAGAMDKPRFPVFLGFRHPIDMSDD